MMKVENLKKIQVRILIKKTFPKNHYADSTIKIFVQIRDISQYAVKNVRCIDLIVCVSIIWFTYLYAPASVVQFPLVEDVLV